VLPCLASRSRRASSAVLITICSPQRATPPLPWLVTLVTGLMFTAAWMLLYRRPMTRDGRVAGRSPDGLGNGLPNGLTVGGWIVRDYPPIGYRRRCPDARWYCWKHKRSPHACHIVCTMAIPGL
jgi:hypothetical protein